MGVTDHRAKADRLARKADERTGVDNHTEATGEGLAAVAHALLGSLPSLRSPQVWLGARADAAAERNMLVRSDRIVAAQVREGDGGRFVLEVFVEGHGPGGRWFAVATGTGEWFELNAAEDLLTLLAETARGEEDAHVPAVFLTVDGPIGDKEELAVDRNF